MKMFVKKQIVEKDVLADLRQQIAITGSQRRWAAANGFSPTFISFVLNGKSKLTPRLLNVLGYDVTNVVSRKRQPMSVSIRFTGAADGDDGPFQLASASGWQAFADWVEGLPDSFEQLAWLVAHGSVTDTAGLAEELQAALGRGHTPSKDVMDTIEQLLTVLGAGDRDETATVEM